MRGPVIIEVGGGGSVTAMRLARERKQQREAREREAAYEAALIATVRQQVADQQSNTRALRAAVRAIRHAKEIR